ncbi:hypothetical protein [Exiguobacterium sp. s129]|uniref:hypothetical protein n=1 Tax=Exiguobacterium sp. s129 TaxID=2751264 RepID=UPI001BEAC475|nr:hypothetical protein [Exiguobacterium sp. s129]
MKRVIQESKEVIKMRDSIENEFKQSVYVLSKMVDELNSENYQLYCESLSFSINSPMEDAIRYKYIVLVELFKKFSQAMSHEYFIYKQGTKSAEKYHLMNMYILKEKDIVIELEKIIDERNDLAHIYYNNFIELTDLDFEKRVKQAKFLSKVLKKYIKLTKKENSKKIEL